MSFLFVTILCGFTLSKNTRKHLSHGLAGPNLFDMLKHFNNARHPSNAHCAANIPRLFSYVSVLVIPLVTYEMTPVAFLFCRPQECLFVRGISRKAHQQTGNAVQTTGLKVLLPRQALYRTKDEATKEQQLKHQQRYS